MINTQLPLYTLNAGASGWVDIRLENLKDMKIIYEVTYAATASTTGHSMYIYQGNGGIDPAEATNLGLPTVITVNASSPTTSVPVFADNNLPVTLQTVTPSSGSQVKKRTSFYLNDVVLAYSEWVRFMIINNDATNSSTFKFYISHR